MVALVHPETDFWIAPDTLIEGENIRLIPLQPEYFDTLLSLGDCAQIWETFQSAASIRRYTAGICSIVLQKCFVGNCMFCD